MAKLVLYTFAIFKEPRHSEYDRIMLVMRRMSKGAQE